MGAMEYAKYVGTADQRVMLGRDWKAAGIEDQDTVIWNAANGYSVARDRFSDDAWAVMATDPGIVFTGERPDAAERDEAAINAAKARLRARMEGATFVLRAQDEIPAAGFDLPPAGVAGTTSGHTEGAKVQGSDASSQG